MDGLRELLPWLNLLLLPVGLGVLRLVLVVEDVKQLKFRTSRLEKRVFGLESPADE